MLKLEAPIQGMRKEMGETTTQGFYTCRKCGTLLSTLEHVLHQEVLSATTGTSQHGLNKGDGAGISRAKAAWSQAGMDKPSCSSVFLHDKPSWAKDDGAHSGRLTCPKCKGRVGSFCWSGATCSCGRWITPSFQLQLSRVDAHLKLRLGHTSPCFK